MLEGLAIDGSIEPNNWILRIMEDSKYSTRLLVAILLVELSPHSSADSDWAKGKWLTLTISVNVEVVEDLYGMDSTVAVRNTSRPVPHSAWLDVESSFFKKVVVDAIASLLVLPIQVDARGFTAPIRVLFGEIITDRFKQAGDTVLADQFLLQKART